MSIETAVVADIPVLCDLLGLLFQQEAEFTPDTGTQARGLEGIIANPDIGFILIARKAGKPVGMVSVLYTISTALGGRVGLLEDMVVAPAHRNKNLGKDLLDRALATAAANGCKRITLLTDGDNVGAHRFYRRAGFEDSSMVVFRRLLDTAGP